MELFVRDSTLDSIKNYKCTLKDGKIGTIIKLINIETGSIKLFPVEYIRKIKNGYVVKNVNNTLVLQVK